MASSWKSELGIMGSEEIRWSFSPAVHSWLLKEHGLSRKHPYRRFIIPRQETESAYHARLTSELDELLLRRVRGISVTMPLKELILGVPGIVSDDPVVKATGVTNTLVNKDVTWKGFNTDAPGLEDCFKRHKLSLEDKNVVVFGAGGMAASAVWAFVRSGVGQVTIASRRLEQAEKLKNRIDFHQNDSNIAAEETDYASNSRLVQAIEAADIICNTTPFGQAHTDLEGRSPLPTQLVTNDRFYIDAVVDPYGTKMLRDAWDVGVRDGSMIRGGELLVSQAIRQFELFTQEDQICNNGLSIQDQETAFKGMIAQYNQERLARFSGVNPT